MTQAREPVLDRLFLRDRLAVAASIVALALAAWVWTFYLSRHMPGGAMSAMDMPGMDMPGMSMDMAPVWGATEYLWLTGMWAVMMVAMMSPSAAPAILLFAGLSRQRQAAGGVAASTATFVAGYFTIWSLFSAAAALLQLLLHRSLLLTSTGASASRLLAGGLLIAAGLYQWSPLKTACLSRCQSPLGFFTAYWREGAGGAFRMGLVHGLNCVGCCWLVMLLLFVAGVMNLLWVAVLAVVVLLERVVPWGRMPARLAGTAFAIAGVWMLLR